MIFLLYLVFPIIEIYLLIKAGEQFGFWPIFGAVILTAWLGARLVKYEGFQVLAQLQSKVSQGQSPHRELLEGVVLLIGGVLLIAPGFITDAFGLLCLFPFSRRFLATFFSAWLLHRIKLGRIQVFTSFGGFDRTTGRKPFSRPMKDVTPPKPESLDQ